MNDDTSSEKEAANLRHGGPSQPGATGGRSTANAREDLAEACRLLSSAADLCLAPPDRSGVVGVADVADFRVLSLGLGAQLAAAQILCLVPPTEEADHDAETTDGLGATGFGSDRSNPPDAFQGFAGFEGFDDGPAAATRRPSAETAADRQVALVDLVRAADALIRRHAVDDLPSGVTAVIVAIGDLLSEVAR